jgi:hypothetical protein
MERQFYLLLSLKTVNGYEQYGQYILGRDAATASRLFNNLSGDGDLSAALHIDLMETTNELPVRVKSIGCTLEELTRNTKLIIREIFRLKNLEGML